MERRIYFRRNVFGGEREGAFVNLFGPGNVTFAADDRELGFSQAGITGGDADAGAIELEAPGVEQWFGTFRAESTSGHGAVHRSSTFWQTNQAACAHHSETETS
jgi:hypothetical protein